MHVRASDTLAGAEVRQLIADLLRSGLAVSFRAEGDSMHPTIRTGDLVHVEPANEVSIGDVAVTLSDRGLTVHRVVQVRDGWVVTRGDDCWHLDRPLDPADVLGRVTKIERHGSRILLRSRGRTTAHLRMAFLLTRRAAARVWRTAAAIV